MKKLLTVALLATLFWSCDVARQVAGTYNMTQCKYEYQSISGLTLSGINLQNATSLSSLNPLAAANLVAAFTTNSGSLPLDFTLNLNVTNPGIQAALLNGMNYILEVDGLQLTTGSMQQQLQVAGGGSSVLPIKMSFDLKKALSGESLETIKNLAFNFAGIGNKPSNVTLKIKPDFLLGTQTISAPNYIPVSFTLNKK